MGDSYRKDAGMDEAMAQKDRAGYTVDVSDVTGGKTKMIGEGCGQEVGNDQPIDLTTPSNK